MIAGESGNAGNVLILARLKKSTGNYSTAHRIREYLEGNGWRCIIKDPSEQLLDAISHDHCEPGHVDALRKTAFCVCLHALHCSRSIVVLHEKFFVPCLLIFGGTDLNEYAKNSQHLEAMTEAVSRARLCVAFNERMKKQALELWPSCGARLRVICQGVQTCPTAFSLKAFLRSQYGLDDPEVFLLVASIRKVKDPLFLAPSFSEWHKRHPKSWLILAGPQMEPDSEELVLDVGELAPGVLYIGSLEQGDLHAAMAECVAVVNSSLSEGMCGAILEAWSMRTLVIARAAPGNTDLIEHAKTGFLYGTSQEFLDCIELVLDDARLREAIIENAYAVVLRQCSITVEREAYMRAADDVKMSHSQLLGNCVDEYDDNHDNRSQKKSTQDF